MILDCKGRGKLFCGKLGGVKSVIIDAFFRKIDEINNQFDLLVGNFDEKNVRIVEEICPLSTRRGIVAD